MTVATRHIIDNLDSFGTIKLYYPDHPGDRFLFKTLIGGYTRYIGVYNAVNCFYVPENDCNLELYFGNDSVRTHVASFTRSEHTIDINGIKYYKWTPIVGMHYFRWFPYHYMYLKSGAPVEIYIDAYYNWDDTLYESPFILKLQNGNGLMVKSGLLECIDLDCNIFDASPIIF